MRYRLKLSPDGGAFTRDHLNKHKSYTESIRVKFLFRPPPPIIIFAPRTNNILISFNYKYLTW
jgi:hypothetical protein